MAVVKADAYGHGARVVGPLLENAGADWFGVATVEEGVALRAAGVGKPILVLYGIWPQQASDAVVHDLSVAVADAEMLPALISAAPAGLKVHLEVDTGMTRLGVRPEEVLRVVEVIRDSGALELEGVFSHFGNADDPHTAFVDEQARVFRKIVAKLESAGRRPPWVHLANSAATLGRPDAHWDMVRPGVSLYGVCPGSLPDVPLQPVMCLETSVWRLWEVPAGRSVGYDQTFTTRRPTRIAVLPIGYADGYARPMSNRGRVLVGGKSAPVIGRVCMDVTMIDVTDLVAVAVGDPVVVFGDLDGHYLPVDEVARACDTIAYEVLVRIGARVPRKIR